MIHVPRTRIWNDQSMDSILKSQNYMKSLKKRGIFKKSTLKIEYWGIAKLRDRIKEDNLKKKTQKSREERKG